jgi:hypothetical protein
MSAKRKKFPAVSTRRKSDRRSPDRTKGSLARAFDLLAGLPEDFDVPRKRDQPQKRSGL